MRKPFFKGSVKMSKEFASISYQAELPDNLRRGNNDRYLHVIISKYGDQDEPWFRLSCGPVTLSDSGHVVNSLEEVFDDFKKTVKF